MGSTVILPKTPFSKPCIITLIPLTPKNTQMFESQICNPKLPIRFSNGQLDRGLVPPRLNKAASTAARRRAMGRCTFTATERPRQKPRDVNGGKDGNNNNGNNWKSRWSTWIMMNYWDLQLFFVETKAITIQIKSGSTVIDYQIHGNQSLQRHVLKLGDVVIKSPFPEQWFRHQFFPHSEVMMNMSHPTNLFPGRVLINPSYYNNMKGVWEMTLNKVGVEIDGCLVENKQFDELISFQLGGMGDGLAPWWPRKTCPKDAAAMGSALSKDLTVQQAKTCFCWGSNPRECRVHANTKNVSCIQHYVCSNC